LKPIVNAKGALELPPFGVCQIFATGSLPRHRLEALCQFLKLHCLLCFDRFPNLLDGAFNLLLSIPAFLRYRVAKRMGAFRVLVDVLNDALIGMLNDALLKSRQLRLELAPCLFDGSFAPVFADPSVPSLSRR
jgi:hypothetical protein